MKTPERRAPRINSTVIFSVVIGITLFAASAWAGNPGLGVAMLVIMLTYAAILSFGKQIDVVQILRGEPADERYAQMTQRSIVFAANVLAIVAVAMFIYEISIDGDPGPYSLMGFVFAVSMIVSLIWQRIRS
jgi:hypothetical protein